MKPQLHIFRALLVLVLFITTSSFGQYTQTNTTISYAGSNVRKSATLPPNDVATFSNAVRAAYVTDGGGNFDFPTAITIGTTSFTDVFGASAAKKVTITSSAPMQNVTSVATFSPVSGNATTTQADNSSYNLTIGPVRDGSNNILPDVVVRVGFVILSRSNSVYPLDVCATAYFNNGTAQSITSTIGYGKGSNNTFFGFSSPFGFCITNVNLSSFGPGTKTPVMDRIAFDDFGFVTAQLPALVITNISPTSGAVVKAANGIQFEVLSAQSSTGPVSVSMMLNFSNVTSQLVITGTNNDCWVAFTNLLPNQDYKARVVASNAQGVATSSFQFSTWESVTALFDSGGFEDSADYPLGALQPVSDGEFTWIPASGTDLVDSGGADHGAVLRTTQTSLSTLQFSPVSSGVLRIACDVHVSTTASRTMELSVLSYAGDQTSFIAWGAATNASGAGQLSYYNGANWVPLTGYDTNWHHIEMIHYLSGPAFRTFDLTMDGNLIGASLVWRTLVASNTPLDHLRLGCQRGVAGEYGEIDNLVVTAEGEAPVSDDVILTNTMAALDGFRFSFETKTNAEYRIDVSASLPAAQWTPLAIVPGSGLTTWFTNQAPSNARQFFRVAKLPPPGYADGYRGIWFTLGQFSEYGDKYSGGLGTYCADHVPICIYAPAVNKTFFVYGGTIKDQRHLLIMASYFDHATHQVPRPTLVYDKKGVNDPHDNAALSIDSDGYLWVFVSGRGSIRPGFKFRSHKPYSIEGFSLVEQLEATYPQPWYVPGKGFLYLFTKYTSGRELYWQTSPDGFTWSEHHKLAGIEGHYQVSRLYNGKIGTFFNRHPGHDVDKRTDLYYAQTTDMGATWTTVDGRLLTLPLTTTNNPARVIDYASQGLLQYTCDLNFDTNGNPVMLYVTSHDYRPGPNGDPRELKITRWTGSSWMTTKVCNPDHNYDMGSLYIRPDRWTIIAPTLVGPQPWQAGGEMQLWVSYDQGATWSVERQITRNSIYNHTYARRPTDATDPFFAFWADGNPTNYSPSRLYFGTSDGTHVWQLPYDMSTPMATPQEISF